MKKIRQPHIDTAGPHANGVMKTGVGIELYLDVDEVGSKAAAPFAIKLAKRLVEDPLEMDIYRCHNPNPKSQPILWGGSRLVNLSSD